MLSSIEAPAPDALMKVARMCRDDARAEKIDLGIGMYRDEAGTVPIMSVIRVAETLVPARETTKGYVGPAGDPVFCELLQDALFPTLSADARSHIVRVQAPGGTGALRLGFELLARAAPGKRVWVGLPTWPNHLPIISALKFAPVRYRHCGPASVAAEFELALSALDFAPRGDVVLLHGCCHNPTGADLTAAHWAALAEIAANRGLIPFIDLAYAGLGDSLEADVAGVVRVLETVPEALVAVSCSKAFGLYRDRLGMLIARVSTAGAGFKVQAAAESTARLLWSNPPDHGAALLRCVLESPVMTSDWKVELNGMRVRISSLRRRLSAVTGERFTLGHLAGRKGLFAVLPLEPAAVANLREKHAIYAEESGRINIAGLNDENFPRFADALRSVLSTT